MQTVNVATILNIGPIQDMGAQAVRDMPPGRRYRFFRATTYSLQDGRTVEGALRGLTKPKLQRRLEETRAYIIRRALFADFDDQGNYQGLTVRS